MLKVTSESVIETVENKTAVRKSRYGSSACDVAGEMDKEYCAIGSPSQLIDSTDNLYSSGSSANSIGTTLTIEWRASRNDEALKT